LLLLDTANTLGPAKTLHDFGACLPRSRTSWPQSRHS
jgi:hypothetical protein